MSADVPLHRSGEPSDEASDQAENLDQPESEESSRKAKRHKKYEQVSRTRASGMWVGAIAAAIVMIFLLVFIVQNNESVEIQFLAFKFDLPLGVALLLAAISAVLIVAIPGALRIMQLRRLAKNGTRDDT